MKILVTGAAGLRARGLFLQGTIGSFTQDEEHSFIV